MTRAIVAAVAIGVLSAGCSGDGNATDATDEVDVPRKVAAISALLDDMVTAYEEGDSTEASDLAAEAYLDNFEELEEPLEEVDEDLTEELEDLLSEDMRDAIERDVPVSELRSLVTEASSLLDEAQAALEGAS